MRLKIPLKARKQAVGTAATPHHVCRILQECDMAIIQEVNKNPSVFQHSSTNTVIRGKIKPLAKLTADSRENISEAKLTNSTSTIINYPRFNYLYYYPAKQSHDHTIVP